MLDFIIIIFLIIGILVGLRRGLILQVIHLLGFIIAFIVAKMYYSEFAEKLVLWIPYPNLDGGDPTLAIIFQSEDLESAYYKAIAFVIIFIAVKLLLHIIGSMLDFIAQLPLLKQFNRAAGGIFGFLEVYLIIFILLYVLALVPLDWIQNALENSILAEGIVKHTPIISQDIEELWIGKN